MGTEREAHEAVPALAIALDLDDLVEALRLAKLLRPSFEIAKVGLELYSAAGPDAVGALSEMGYQVFVDLKLLDIPTTVARASRVLGSIGASYVTFHARGGVPMLKAGVEGLVEGAEAASLPRPSALAVTVLTSEADAPAHVVRERTAAAVGSGCSGVICAAGDVRLVKEIAPRMLAVVPGIRPAGTDRHDQARAASPRSAAEAGADVLVIGRAVTAAQDPLAAATAIRAELGTSC